MRAIEGSEQSMRCNPLQQIITLKRYVIMALVEYDPSGRFLQLVTVPGISNNPLPSL